ncbi:alpha/beta hydrolase [Nonomuraea sp. NPDC049419]|uniref:alpha/beta hydrolase n=1 Tax=Nonomuraea sp. NPDC049419 TaxID=3155772 RepID=UPI00342BA91E
MQHEIVSSVAGETAGLEEALSRVVRLAGDHIGALDSTMRHMAAHAWVGGGAAPFTQATQDQRSRLQLAFDTAAAQIAERIRALGGNATAPSLSTSLPISTSARGGYAGMDVEAMTRMVTDLERAGHELPTAGSRLSAALGTACVSAAPGQQVGAVGAWASGQATDLRRRLTVLQQRPAGDMANAAALGFGLFGGFAPDPNGLGGLLTSAANGDPEALKKVLEAQNSGRDSTLASRVSAWWQMLDPAARQQLINAAPQLVGSLNGVPSATRDSANRAYLSLRKSAVAKQLAELRKLEENMKRGARHSHLLMEMSALDAEQRQIAAVERSLAMGGLQGRPPALLLHLELGGLGKTAISFGDPDKADSVVTSVPGTGSTLEGVGGDAARAMALWERAHNVPPGTEVASTIWLGYEAPQLNAGVLMADSSVASPRLAQTGAGALAGFLDGLHATHRPTGTPRFTVLGHSYGSVVTGIAAQARKGTFADQLILVGSPGTMAARANDLGVKHVWVGESPHDPIADLGHLPLSGGRNPISGVLNPWFPNGAGPFGTDPSNIAFGANRFVVDPKPVSGPLAFTGYDIGTHSDYWEAQSESLRNMGFIINGQYDRVTVLPTPKQAPPPSPSPQPRPSPEPVSPPSSTAQPSPTPTGD